MRLHALKLGLAAAIVAAIVSLVALLFATVSPYGPMGGGHMMLGGNMMRGPAGYPHMYRLGWGGVIFVGLIVRPVAAGVAAWALAVVYNRLLGPATPTDSAANPSG